MESHDVFDYLKRIGQLEKGREDGLDVLYLLLKTETIPEPVAVKRRRRIDIKKIIWFTRGRP